MSAPPLQHDISVCFDSATAPETILLFGGGAAPVVVRVLRRTEQGSLRSVIATLPPGWRVDGRGTAGHMQGYVLEGALELDARALMVGGFFVQRGGTGLRGLASASGARVLFIFDSAPDFKTFESQAPLVFLADAMQVEPFVPVINGQPVAGFQRRVLWKDTVSGADTRLLKIAQFEGKGPNWHPVHEEIFCLAGDIGPDDRRLMKPGWFLHNPANGIHGFREHSNGGATVLEWHDGEWAINFV